MKYADSGLSGAPPVSIETRDDGLVIEELRVGEGPRLKRGDHVYIHYTGWLAEGMRKFDSSLDRGPYMEYSYGIHSVNPGFDAGIAEMRVGGKRRLRVPSELGYGTAGSGPVPPDCDLVYEVELLDATH